MIPTPASGSTHTPLLTPPRPNLGPLPLDDPSFVGEFDVISFVVIVAVAVVSLTLACAVLCRRIRRRKRTMNDAKADSQVAVPLDPRDRLILASKRVREALESRFGAAWRAQTTEEIENRPELVASCDSEVAARLVALLRNADRAKFASNRPCETDQSAAIESAADDWAWLDGALAGLTSATEHSAPTKSRINGK